MRLLAVLSVLLLASAIGAGYGETHSVLKRCHAGVGKGYLTVRTNPAYLIGTIPSEYTKEQKYFEIRYNCLRGSAFIRRVDLGTYDVKFPRLKLHGGVASAMSLEGGDVSLYQLKEDEFRVVIRGPRMENNLHILRDIPFSIVVY